MHNNYKYVYYCFVLNINHNILKNLLRKSPYKNNHLIIFFFLDYKNLYVRLNSFIHFILVHYIRGMKLEN